MFALCCNLKRFHRPKGCHFFPFCGTLTFAWRWFHNECGRWRNGRTCRGSNRRLGRGVRLFCWSHRTSLLKPDQRSSSSRT